MMRKVILGMALLCLGLAAMAADVSLTPEQLAAMGKWYGSTTLNSATVVGQGCEYSLTPTSPNEGWGEDCYLISWSGGPFQVGDVWKQQLVCPADNPYSIGFKLSIYPSDGTGKLKPDGTYDDKYDINVTVNAGETKVIELAIPEPIMWHGVAMETTYWTGSDPIVYGETDPYKVTVYPPGDLTPPENPRNLDPAGETIDKDVYPNLLDWDGPAWTTAQEPNIVKIDYDVDYYSKQTGDVTSDDPNFIGNAYTTVTTDANFLAVALDYQTTYFWRVTAYTVWDSNAITGNWVDAGTAQAQFSTLSDDLAPVVSIPDASDKIITWLDNLPESGLAGTVSDEQIATVVIDWDIIAGPGIAPNATKQSSNRNAYTADPNYTNLLQDWIGTDSRTSAGGIDTMYLTLSGVPSGTYTWTAYHHDTQDQTGLFDMTITDSSGTVTDPNIDMTAGVALPFADICKVTKTITSNGSDDIVLVFTQQVNEPVEESFFALNGFVLDDLSNPPLMVDFGSDASKVQNGYAAYTATNEDPADFVATDYLAFGGQMVTVTPSWDDPNPTAEVVPTASPNEAPTARFETLTNVTGTYTVQLTATDYKDQSASDTLTVVVAADPCAAAKATAGFALNYYDRDGDCDVDLLDFAEFADEWLDDKKLDGTVFE